MSTEIIFPEMGEGVIEGTLSRWLVNEGDEIEEFEPLAEVETDKVTTEITSEVAGTVLKLMVDEGQTIPVDTILAYIGQPGEEINGEKSDSQVKSAMNGDSPPPEIQKKEEESSSRPSKQYTGRISPLVGRIAAEHDVDLALVQGTGREGRITKDDILSYVETREQKSETKEESQAVVEKPQKIETTQIQEEKSHAELETESAPSDGQVLPMTSMRRAIAEHMVHSKRTSPHVTTVFEIDFSAVAAHRAQNKESFARDGANLTYTVYMIAATVQALKKHPMANSVWSEDGIILKSEINIGMAAAVPEGLTVPVIKGADGLNLLGLARVINDLTERARNKKLRLEDLQDGTFSITNHGTSGSLFATPIINQPQAGILGFGKIEKRVKVIDDAIAIRPLAYASFTFDHRILDGATADAFVSSIKEIIESWS